jgi:23S rRNA (cytidine1920-2'-O)/16S rRNA (cytidine1409-2'-O)-methyltransferase
VRRSALDTREGYLAKLRLDAVMVERGLVATRERARALILAGQVIVDGQVVSKAGAPVAADALVALASPEHPYVSRGGVKLAGALDAFRIDPSGRAALDVGHGQLDWRLRNDPRVLVRERVNARALTSEDVPHPVDLVTIDVAFISLRYILPALPPFLTTGADIVALVKPQFEAGRDEVGRHGIVSDPAIHDAVIARVTEAADALGLKRAGMAPAAITGATGNQEFFLHLEAR